MSVITQHNATMIQAIKSKGYIPTSTDEEIETGFQNIMIGRSHIHFANVYEDGSFHLYGTHLDSSLAYDSNRLHGCSEDEFMTFLSVWLDNFN